MLYCGYSKKKRTTVNYRFHGIAKNDSSGSFVKTNWSINCNNSDVQGGA